MYATLAADKPSPKLYLGSLLRERGFDVEKKYTLLWDAETLELGLEPSENGFKVFEGHKLYAISAGAFCRRFGIKDRLEAILVSELGNTWILRMKKVD
jgi:hypothetical protein